MMQTVEMMKRMVKKLARNENTSHFNKSSLYVACTGGGKSQCLSQNKAIPKNNCRVFLWDPDHDHKSTRVHGKAAYKAAVIGGIKSGRGFRLSFVSDAGDVDDFEWFCALAWAALDGEYISYVIIEELASVTETASKATKNFGLLLNRGRKYGAQLHITTQRGSEISKTAYIQCQNTYIGIQRGNDVKKMAEKGGVTRDQILSLKPLQFWFSNGGAHSTLHKVKYKKVIK